MQKYINRRLRKLQIKKGEDEIYRKEYRQENW